MMLRWTTSPDPWRDFRAVRRQMQAQMDDLVRGLARPERPRLLRQVPEPAFELSEKPEAYVLRAALPGLRKEDLQLEATGESLTIAAKRKVETPEGYRAHRTERGDLELRRTFNFGARLDVESITATLHDGMLTIELPKQADERPRTIAISAA